MKHRLLPALVTLAVILGCSDSTSPSTPSMAGSWSGTISGASVSFVTTSSSGTLSGNGYISAGTTSIAFTVAGTHVHPDVSLTIEATGYEPMSFTGQFVTDDQVSGRLNGSGYSNTQFIINRQ